MNCDTKAHLNNAAIVPMIKDVAKPMSENHIACEDSVVDQNSKLNKNANAKLETEENTTGRDAIDTSNEIPIVTNPPHYNMTDENQKLSDKTEIDKHSAERQKWTSNGVNETDTFTDSNEHVESQRRDEINSAECMLENTVKEAEYTKVTGNSGLKSE